MFDRITVDPSVMAGQPTIRGMRFPVATVVRMVAHGLSVDEILHEHPDLEAPDIFMALEYAAAAVESESYLPLNRTA
ncbi:MAG: DUF433 domain-containing protein [Ancrocorticia sp.]